MVKKNSMHLFFPKKNQLPFCSKPGYPPPFTLKPDDATSTSGFLQKKIKRSKESEKYKLSVSQRHTLWQLAMEEFLIFSLSLLDSHS